MGVTLQRKPAISSHRQSYCLSKLSGYDPPPLCVLNNEDSLPRSSIAQLPCRPAPSRVEGISIEHRQLSSQTSWVAQTE
jgi:hypothetical protein